MINGMNRMDRDLFSAEGGNEGLAGLVTQKNELPPVAAIQPILDLFMIRTNCAWKMTINR